MFRNSKIIFRIGLVIAIFSFLMVGLAIVGYIGIDKINKKQEELVNLTFVKVELTQNLRFLARHKAVIVRNIFLFEDPPAKKIELQRIKEEEKEYDETLARLTALLEKPEEKAILDRVVTDRNETNVLWDRAVQYGMSGKTTEGMKLLIQEVRSREWRWLDDLNAMVQLQKEYARSNYKDDLATSTHINLILVVLDLIAIGTGLLLATVISRSITGPLKDFTLKVDKIARGDLSVQVDYDTTDEIGLLGKNINRMVRMRKKNLDELEAYRLHLVDLVEQRTEEISRQRERFVSVLIHDLKGPVTPILGFTRRLIAGKAKTGEDTLAYLKTIEKSSIQLVDIIDKTLIDLRNKSAEEESDIEIFDFCGLLRTTAASFLPRTEEREIAFLINSREKDDWDKLEPILFKGDSRQLRTMLENLLSNEVKYAQTIICLEVEKTDRELLLNVSDDGPGIAEEYRDKIFEHYFQIPGSRKGTGIGLYSVRKVVENHGGMISVESRGSEGACFKVVLPIT